MDSGAVSTIRGLSFRAAEGYFRYARGARREGPPQGPLPRVLCGPVAAPVSTIAGLS
jgi:hypothetical protein